MKILLVAEEISHRPNEGTLVFLMHLERFLRPGNALTTVHAAGEAAPEARALRLAAPKILLTPGLACLLRRMRFDVAVYVPRAGLTACALARAALLRSLAGAAVVVIGLQERKIGFGHRFFARRGRLLVLSPSAAVRDALGRGGVRADFIMPGFDERLFRPPGPQEKARLRSKYALPSGRFILLHTGHVRKSRNLDLFLRHREWGADIQPVIKAGRADAAWTRRLRSAGVIVIEEYIEAVHELYQAADGYLFPVSEPTGAVEFPLSVIEACACNLPVLTTRFGSLPAMIGEGDGLRYFGREEEIAPSLAALRGEEAATAAKVAGFGWNAVLERYLAPHLRALAQAAGEEAAQ